jgi:hypothetical protein
VACLCIPLALLAQYGGRHGGANSSGNRGSATAPADNPDDLSGFKVAVAVQATEEQSALFTSVAKAADLAQRNAEALRRSTSDDAVHRATMLHNSIDEVQSESRKFFNTFSDSQSSGLKKQIKKLEQSESALSKEGKKLDAELDQIPPDSKRLLSLPGSLQKTLSLLQADQTSLGKAMGIQ